MIFIHTADWHLGRLFHGVHLTDDQQFVLDQFVGLVDGVRPAAVLLAGDVYDRGVPPPEAVELLNDVLDRIVRGLGVPVVMIAGNHDSPTRLGFGSQMLSAEGLHIAGRLPAGGVLNVPLADSDGPLVVQAVPFADPIIVREALAEPDIQTHEQAMRALMARARAAVPTGARSVLVGHAFVAGAEVSDSERPLTVGGAGTVPAAVFAGFDYVALGHLHRPQRAGAEAVRYAGSLLTYSFDEVAQPKSVSVVEIGAPGSGVAVEQVELQPRRRVRVIEGTLHDILERAPADEARDDYVCARLLDTGALLNAMGRLQQAYPNCLHLEFPRNELAGGGAAPLADPVARSAGEHFATFFEYVTDERLSASEGAAFGAVLERLERRRRES